MLVPILSIYICSWDKLMVYLKSLVMQADYEWKLTDSMEIADGIRVWYPVDGFRMKAAYRNSHLNAYGNEW